MSDAPRPGPDDQARAFEDWSRTADASELANAVRAWWKPYGAGGVSGSRLTTEERTMAFLHLRLAEYLVKAADRLTAASNSGTRTLGRLTAVYVALTGVIALATLVGAGVALHQALPGHGMVLGVSVATLAGTIVALCAWLTVRLWPKD